MTTRFKGVKRSGTTTTHGVDTDASMLFSRSPQQFHSDKKWRATVPIAYAGGRSLDSIPLDEWLRRQGGRTR